MPTEDEFASITSKKLLGFVDFDVYLLKYLRKAIRDATKRLFIQGSFEERMPLAAYVPGVVFVELKPSGSDGLAHDGAGRLLDLAMADRSATFENVIGQVYEVGARYVEFPRDIRINPRTGKAEYDRLVEGIGVESEPTSVEVGSSALTFVVDRLFEEGSPGDHTGRRVRVFRVVPGDMAMTAPIAIEECTVFYDGQNKITTVGTLGQTVPDSGSGAYRVQLIGIVVLRDTAPNRPSQMPTEAFFIGTVTGNGDIPGDFDVSGQNVIQAQSASDVTVDPLPDWADFTSNPGGTVQGVLEKMIGDLTSTVDARGAGKLTAPALTAESDFPHVDPRTVAGSLQELLDLVNAETLRSELRAEVAAIHSLKQVATSAVGAISDIALATWPSAGDFVAVGSGGLILARRKSDGRWIQRPAGSGYAGQFNAAAWGGNWAIVGETGEIQYNAGGTNWVRGKTGGPTLWDVAHKNSSPQTFCAVGAAGSIWTGSIALWTQRTGAPGTTTEEYRAIASRLDPDTNENIFVVTTSAGKIITSPDGVVWTLRSTLTGTSPSYAYRMIQHSERHGFIALFIRNSSAEWGISQSFDGITWTHTVIPSISTGGGIPFLLDRSVCYMIQSSTSPWVLSVLMNLTGGVPDLQPTHMIPDVSDAFFRPAGALNLDGALYFFGAANSGDGVIFKSASFRPNLLADLSVNMP